MKKVNGDRSKRLSAIARELVKDCPKESREDHKIAASWIRLGNFSKALEALMDWPESQAWLRAEWRQ